MLLSFVALATAINIHTPGEQVMDLISGPVMSTAAYRHQAQRGVVSGERLAVIQFISGRKKESCIATVQALLRYVRPDPGPAPDGTTMSYNGATLHIEMVNGSLQITVRQENWTTEEVCKFFTALRTVCGLVGTNISGSLPE